MTMGLRKVIIYDLERNSLQYEPRVLILPKRTLNPLKISQIVCDYNGSLPGDQRLENERDEIKIHSL